MRRLALLTAALLFTSPQIAYAQKVPEKIKLTPQSNDGAVLIRVPSKPFSHALQFSKNGSSGFGSRVYIMKVSAGSADVKYIARTLSPGVYRLDSIWQQGHWSACLEAGTVEFEVKAGQIAFLGTLDTDQVLQSIQGEAVRNDRTVVSGTDYAQSHDEVEAPIIVGREASDVSQARLFADQTMNGTGSLINLVDIKRTEFGTSKLGKFIKVCG